MSFASSAREEIAQRSPTKECCVRAAAYGIACFAKYFDARGLVLQTEQPHTVQLAQQLFARCGIRGEILEKPRASGVLYEFGAGHPPARAVRHHRQGDQFADRPRAYPLPDLRQCLYCHGVFVQRHGYRPAKGI